jgi:MoxR-like ATPase
MDSHISRTDLIGRDAIVLKDGKQVTAFQEGIIPLALRRPVALVFDEYDAGRPDVMFVIQRILEAQGKLTLVIFGNGSAFHLVAFVQEAQAEGHIDIMENGIVLGPTDDGTRAHHR